MPQIERTERFDARFQSKAPQEQAAILKAIKLLADDPRHPSLRVKGITHRPGLFAARVTRSDRLSFQWGERGRIVLRNNCHHDELYGHP